jgi:hypothetical protein
MRTTTISTLPRPSRSATRGVGISGNDRSPNCKQDTRERGADLYLYYSARSAPSSVERSLTRTPTIGHLSGISA